MFVAFFLGFQLWPSSIFPKQLADVLVTMARTCHAFHGKLTTCMLRVWSCSAHLCSTSVVLSCPFLRGVVLGSGTVSMGISFNPFCSATHRCFHARLPCTESREDLSYFIIFYRQDQWNLKKVAKALRLPWRCFEGFFGVAESENAVAQII